MFKMKTICCTLVFLILITFVMPPIQIVHAYDLPFTATVTGIRNNVLITPGENGMDLPERQVTINGEVWVFSCPNPYVNPTPIKRWKGPDLENMVEQPSGVVNIPAGAPPGGWAASSFFNSGFWYDSTTGTLYALIHVEYEHNTINPGDNISYQCAAWCKKKIQLATSTDLGLTWTFVGDVLTSTLSDLGEYSKFSGTEFEMGPSDFDLYVDNNYFYVTSWNGFVYKNGAMDKTVTYSEVARCAISDKMLPGNWYKYNNGTWTEPGLGGKASRVGYDYLPIYGNTIYSSYLNRYLRIGKNIMVGDRGMNYGMNDGSLLISSCTSLELQDWTPAAKLYDEPANRMFAISLADANGISGSVCGQTLHVYNYWQGMGGRVFDITLGTGTMPAIDTPLNKSYSYEPHPEAGDTIESRQTRIVGCASPEMRYTGSGWSVEDNSRYYKGQVKKCSTSENSVEFSFKGSDIYWRAVGSRDGGKADVYIDDQLQTTVDCYFWDTNISLEKQFAYIKTGLSANTTHTIRIVIRGDKNPASSDTVIRHMGFEYSAESYRALAGFSSIQGKNNWYYQLWNGTSYSNMTYDLVLGNWFGTNCSMGYDWQIAEGTESSVRKWVAPHNGYVRIDGSVGNAFSKVTWDPVVTYVDSLGTNTIPAGSDSYGSSYTVSIKKNSLNLMSFDLGDNTPQTPYDIYAQVSTGDSIYFSAAPALASYNKKNDDSGSITYSGNWTDTYDYQCYLGDEHYTNAANAYCEFSFTGTSIKWIGAKNTNFGTADVYIDGGSTPVATVNQNGPLQRQVVLYQQTWAQSGNHTIKIVARTQYTSVDAFEYTSWGRVNDTFSKATYSANMLYGGPTAGYYCLDGHYSNVTGEWSQFVFKGSGVRWIGTKGPNRGKADVYIDGSFVATVDPYAASYTAQQVIYESPALFDGYHTLKMVVKGEKNANSNNYYLDWDAFEVYSTSTVTYKASAGFSSTQGTNQWSYQYCSASGSDYTNMGTYDTANAWWRKNGLSSVPVIGSSNMHPGNLDYDAVRKWTSPYAGTVRITGTAKKADIGGGDGVRVRIFKNDTQIWPSSGWQTILYSDTTGISHDLFTTVATGDNIYFIVNANTGDYAYDMTSWDPTIQLTPAITYQSSTGFSSMQGNNQWNFQYCTAGGSNYSNMLTYDSSNQWWRINGNNSIPIIGGGVMHPGNLDYDAVRKWTSPNAGSIRIVGSVKKADPNGGDGVRVKIMKNGTQLWPSSGWQTIAYNDTTGYNYDVVTTVASGDNVYFVVNANSGGYAFDMTAWDPVIQLTHQ